MTTFTLHHGLSHNQEKWLTQHIGPRSFYLHNQIGGKNWIVKRNPARYSEWTITFTDDKMATLFALRWL